MLLRGVNVNGITVTSAALTASMLSISGVEAARTVLASGNVVVQTAHSPATLKTLAESALRRDFGYHARVVVLTADELGTLMDAVPWADDDPSGHVYLTLTNDPTALDDLETLAADAGVDAFVRVHPQAVAWLATKGTSTDAPAARILARSRFTASTTTRNLRTLERLRHLRP